MDTSFRREERGEKLPVTHPGAVVEGVGVGVGVEVGVGVVGATQITSGMSLISSSFAFLFLLSSLPLLLSFPYFFLYRYTQNCVSPTTYHATSNPVSVSCY